jgi:hypothetical protein
MSCSPHTLEPRRWPLHPYLAVSLAHLLHHLPMQHTAIAIEQILPPGRSGQWETGRGW